LSEIGAYTALIWLVWEQVGLIYGRYTGNNVLTWCGNK
jgi:hypothetical protein